MFLGCAWKPRSCMVNHRQYHILNWPKEPKKPHKMYECVSNSTQNIHRMHFYTYKSIRVYFGSIIFHTFVMVSIFSACIIFVYIYIWLQNVCSVSICEQRFYTNHSLRIISLYWVLKAVLYLRTSSTVHWPWLRKSSSF